MIASIKDPARFTALIIYVLVFATFLSICAIAVITTSSQEQSKTGFQAIQVEKPISFFDQTYVAPESSSSNEVQ